MPLHSSLGNRVRFCLKKKKKEKSKRPADMMGSRLLPGAGSLAVQALRAQGPSGAVAVCSLASGGGVPTDDQQATGLERES